MIDEQKRQSDFDRLCGIHMALIGEPGPGNMNRIDLADLQMVTDPATGDVTIRFIRKDGAYVDVEAASFASPQKFTAAFIAFGVMPKIPGIQCANMFADINYYCRTYERYTVTDSPKAFCFRLLRTYFLAVGYEEADESGGPLSLTGAVKQATEARASVIKYRDAFYFHIPPIVQWASKTGWKNPSTVTPHALARLLREVGATKRELSDGSWWKSPPDFTIDGQTGEDIG